MLKSYLDDEEKRGLSQNALYAAESMAADKAGDDETALAWLRKVDIPAYALMAGRRRSAPTGSPTRPENRNRRAGYGPDWLDRWTTNQPPRSGKGAWPRGRGHIHDGSTLHRPAGPVILQ